MTGPIKKLEFTLTTLQSFELVYTNGKTFFFVYGLAVLLKTKALNSTTADSLTDMTLSSVKHGIKRRQSKGLSGLSIKPERGHKPLICDMDEESVFTTIKAH